MPTELSGVDQLTTTTTTTTRRPTPTTTTATSLAKQGGAPQQEPEHLPCPRCDSTNTKFCYYNNYNFSQPRHFCKSCRRYWTHGGTLRDIPVGGGTRKNAKRSRTSTTTAAAAAAASLMGPITASNIDNIPLPATPLLLPLTANQGLSMHFGGGGPGGCGGDGKSNGGGGGAVSMGGSFTSLLNTQGPTGILALQGFGLGLGPALEDVNFGLGRGVWPFPPLGDVGAGVGGNGAVAVTAGLVNNTWQFESGGENGFGGGDCFPWPDLAISTPGNGLK